MLERYYRELLNFLTRQVGDRDTAADLTQESFVRVLGAQSSGQAVLDMRALLYRTARKFGSRTRLRITGSDTVQFSIPDTAALDRASQRLLERFL